MHSMYMLPQFAGKIQFCVNAKLHVVNTVHVCIMIRNNQRPIRSDDTDYTRVL